MRAANSFSLRTTAFKPGRLARLPGLLAATECGSLSAMSKAEAIYDKVRALPETAQTAVLRVVELLAVGQAPGSPGGTNSVGMLRRFEELAETWKRETRYLSFMEQRAM